MRATVDTPPATRSACQSAASPNASRRCSFDPIPVVARHRALMVRRADDRREHGKSFKISDFSGKVILVDTMRLVPTCQGEMSQVQSCRPCSVRASSLVRISLDIDPNEDSTILKKYAAEKSSSTWYIAVPRAKKWPVPRQELRRRLLNPPLAARCCSIDKTAALDYPSASSPPSASRRPSPVSDPVASWTWPDIVRFGLLATTSPCVSAAVSGFLAYLSGQPN